ALAMPEEGGDRRVHREHDARLAGQLTEPLRPRIVHPEPALEVDLAGGVAAFAEQGDGLLGTLARRHARRAEPGRTHRPPTLSHTMLVRDGTHLAVSDVGCPGHASDRACRCC